MSHRINGRSSTQQLSQFRRRVLSHLQLALSSAGNLTRFIPFVRGGRRELGFADIDVPDSFFDPLPATELRYWSNCISPEDCV